LISIEISTLFTTFHNQYKNQINVIIKAKLVFVENQNIYDDNRKINVKIEIINK